MHNMHTKHSKFAIFMLKLLNLGYFKTLEIILGFKLGERKYREGGNAHCGAATGHWAQD